MAPDVEEFLLGVQDMCKEAFTEALGEIEGTMWFDPDSLKGSSMNGGKLLRPALVLLVNHACNGGPDDLEDALNFGVAVQLMHVGSLTHDDVVDNDPIRRGLKALHSIIGVPAAILTGDVTLTKALKIAKKYGPKVVDIGVDALSDLCTGFVREMHLSGPRFDEKVYMQVISLKTAALTAAAARLGAISAEAPEALEMTAHEYGRQLGLHFQKTDDLVDLLHSLREGRPEGDLREGKLTWPTFEVFGRLPKPEDLALDRLPQIRDGMRRIRVQLCTHEKNMDASTDRFPSEETRPLLREFPRFLFRKMLEEKRVLSLWQSLIADDPPDSASVSPDAPPSA